MRKPGLLAQPSRSFSWRVHGKPGARCWPVIAGTTRLVKEDLTWQLNGYPMHNPMGRVVVVYRVVLRGPVIPNS